MNVSNVLLHLIHKAVVSKYIKKYIQERNPMNIINVLKPFYITIIFNSSYTRSRPARKDATNQNLLRQKLYCLHLQEQERARARERMAKPRPF